MKVTMDLRVLAAGVVIGAVAASWLAPLPARAADAQAGYEYRHVTLLHVARDKIVNDAAADGWEPVLTTVPGFNADVLFRRKKP